jgi:subtilisin family serine protease
VKLVVLDTGLPKHVDLDVAGSKSMIPGYLEDKNGHATHVGGIIAAIAQNGMGVAGISPNVEDFYGAVLNGEGGGSLDDVIRGIYWAVDEIGADIINMSLGVPDYVPLIREMEAACDYAVEQGCLVVAAAGNEASGVGQPAMYDSVVAVAAVDSDQEHAYFSNTGPEVDFAAGGVDVYSTYLGNSYAKLSGTSMASPALAAVAALIKAKHRQQDVELTPTELKEHIRKIAYDVGPGGFDETYGHGIPIFGKPEGDVPEEPPEEEPDTPNKKDKGPSANCLYWRTWGKFISKVDRELRDGAYLEDAFAEGIRLLAKETKHVDQLLRRK